MVNIMTVKIKIKGYIQNIDDAKEVFNEVISNIEKHYEKACGFFSVSFENQFGIPRKSQTKLDASPNTKT